MSEKNVPGGPKNGPSPSETGPFNQYYYWACAFYQNTPEGRIQNGMHLEKQAQIAKEWHAD